MQARQIAFALQKDPVMACLVKEYASEKELLRLLDIKREVVFRDLAKEVVVHMQRGPHTD